LNRDVNSSELRSGGLQRRINVCHLRDVHGKNLNVNLLILVVELRLDFVKVGEVDIGQREPLDLVLSLDGSETFADACSVIATPLR
jgi:hypothetical protein